MDTVETQLRIKIVVLVIHLGRIGFGIRILSWWLVRDCLERESTVRDQIVAVSRLIAEKV